MVDNLITQIGVGGVLVVIILREVFKFLSERSEKVKYDSSAVIRNGAAGAKSVEFWQQQQRTAVREVLTELIPPFLIAQTDILRAIRESSDKTREGIQELVIHAQNQRTHDRDRN